jgi:hypothetical protein
MSVSPHIVPGIEREEDIEQESAEEPPYRVLIHK